MSSVTTPACLFALLITLNVINYVNIAVFTAYRVLWREVLTYLLIKQCNKDRLKYPSLFVC